MKSKIDFIYEIKIEIYLEASNGKGLKEMDFMINLVVGKTQRIINLLSPRNMELEIKGCQ